MTSSMYGYNPITGKLDRTGGGGGAGGDVVGPGSSVIGNIVVFSDVDGKSIADTGLSSTSPVFSGNVTTLSNYVMSNSNAAGTAGVLKAGAENLAFCPIPAGATFCFGNAGNFTMTGIANTLTGQAAGLALTSGLQNCAYGNAALASSQTGLGNSAFGYIAARELQAGDGNISIGYGAQSAALTFDQCIAIGSFALEGCSGNGLVSIGTSSGKASLTASYSTYLGYQAGALPLSGNTAGNNNVGIGVNALGAGCGDNNISIGDLSSADFTGNESNNIIIANRGVAGDNNTMRLGTTGTGVNEVSSTYIAGISGVSVAGAVPVVIGSDGQMGTVVSSLRYKKDIQDLETQNILDLRPVSFTNILTNEKSVGLIAEEVAEVIPDLVVFKDGLAETVKYQDLCTYLLLEVKRLSERLDALEK